MCAFYMHIDQDDAFYIGTASTDLKTNSIYRYDPYTGYEYKLLPSRYVLSPFPVYLSFISRLIGMHPLSVAHTLFPIVFISMSYMAYYLIGGELLGDSKRDKGVFLLFISLIQMCSFYSVYTQGTFLLLRIWQGKSILANLILPMIFYLAIRTFREMGQKKEWVMLFCYMGAASFVSSMGIMLAPIELGIFMMIYGVLGGQWHKVPKGILCCKC